MTASERVSFLAMWTIQQRRNPALQIYHAPGTGTSYPIPAWTGSELLIRYFHHVSDLVGPDTVHLSAPERVLTLKYPSWEFAGVQETDFGLKPFEPLEFTLTAEQRAARRPLLARLERLYDDVMAAYPMPPTPTTTDAFLATLREIVPAPLWPYYEVLLQDFNAWLNR